MLPGLPVVGERMESLYGDLGDLILPLSVLHSNNWREPLSFVFEVTIVTLTCKANPLL